MLKIPKIGEVVKSARESGYLAIILAAAVPFANFAAVNAREGIPVGRLCMYAAGVAAAGLLLASVAHALAPIARQRSAFAISVFILLFFSFSAVQSIIRTAGVTLFIVHGTVTLLICAIAWWSTGRASVCRFWLSTLAVMLVLSAGNYAVRSSQLQSANNSDSLGAANQRGADRDHLTNSVRHVYDSLGTTAAVIPTAPHLVKATDGASFLAAGLTARRANAMFRVHVVANLYSTTDTMGVIAVFRIGQQLPVALQSKAVTARARALFDMTFDVAAGGLIPVTFDVHAGSATGETVLINGPDLASKPAAIPLPYISVTEVDQPAPIATAADRRDVYYLTLDAYPRADVLKEVFDFDNSPFINSLKSRGFLVAVDSYANYFTTHLSVPGAMEQRFIVDESDNNVWNKIPWFDAVMNGHNRVFHHFQDLGYFVSKLNFLESCPIDAFVDYCYLKKKTINPWISWGVSDVELSLMRLTPVHTWLQLLHPSFFYSWVTVENMDDVMSLVELSKQNSPRFVYAHIFLPHAPYRFDADCAWARHVDIDGNESPDPKKRFLDQVQCANRGAIEYVDRIIKNDPQAIILINSDHGSGFKIDWSLPYNRWPDSAVRQRLGNFDAMRLPERCKDLFYDRISPVNYFELVFACIEHREPQYGEDRIYLSTFEKAVPQYGHVWRYR